MAVWRIASVWRIAAVVHPFPSALDALVTAVIATFAGAPLVTAAQLAASMLFVQFGIGAANDWADAAADSRSRPGKPIAAGLLTRRQAAFVAAVCASAGLLLAAPAGAAVAIVAVAGLAAGLAYDLGLKGTPWAWLAFAAGFVLLPLFAWLGGAGGPPPAFGWIVLLAVPAAFVVSLANGLVDRDTDARVGRRSPAVRLGPRRAYAALALAHVLVAGGAAATLALAIGPPGAGASALPWAGLLLGFALLAAGRPLSGQASRERRLLGWHVQATGLAALAGSWFLGMSA